MFLVHLCISTVFTQTHTGGTKPHASDVLSLPGSLSETLERVANDIW